MLREFDRIVVVFWGRILSVLGKIVGGEAA